MKSRARTDLLLLHAPSVYDFRRRAILYGPVSDMVPSSPVFEMYPLGFLTIASYLHDRGFDVRIVNLALRMMRDARFDVPRFLAGLAPRAIGIDLHWLPHAHGALEVARLCKERHPDVPVIMGGLSASYFHEELIRYPQVDFVLRGDSTEAPLQRLLEALRRGAPCDDVPNLTWKRGDEVRVNPQGYVPDALDYADLRPDVFAGMVLRHRDLASTLPLQHWLQNPMTALLTVKGCSHDCVTCGASRTTFRSLAQRTRPAFRSPASLVANMASIARISRAPIYLVGDVLQAGPDAAREVLERLRHARLPNEIIFEFLDLPPEEFLQQVERHVPRWSMEISPDSHDPALRQAQDGEPPYDNARMEAVFTAALRHGCRRIDVFFMIGLPGQTRESVRQTVDYCERLFRLCDRRLACFISPMGPFLDPGSRAFEDPERHGYRLFARTLEEHRQLLVQPTWERILNYETRWMTRRELVDATYDAAERLNALKARHGRIPRREARAVDRRIAAARALRARLDRALDDGTPVPRELQGEINRFSLSTVCDKRELFWPRHLFNFRPGGLARLALAQAASARLSRPPSAPAAPTS
ncbi:MAG TPA: TIGR04190 family B12-binding domain/radical SAM domain protein [Steroidobacteraceae bacterium]|nr:TIGR04190 family B12-binding domain/radical SAM domain protein [Steroidobacteraceae bacterium]